MGAGAFRVSCGNLAPNPPASPTENDTVENMTKNDIVDARVARAARALSEYLAGGRESTHALKEVAAAIVDLRESTPRPDGSPDLSGRTTAYRAAVSDIYARARVPREDYDGIQTALRYHVSNLLHERHSSEELAAAGMSPRSAKDRRALDREVGSTLREALRDPVLLAVRIAALAELLDGAALAAADARRARAARLALEQTRQAADAAVAAIDAAHKPRRGRGKATGT